MKDYIRTRYPAFFSANFRTYWFGQLASNIGTQMFIVGINWHIYVLTKSAFALGFIGLLRFLAVFGFSLIGGVFADSHDRRKIMFITQSTMAVLSAILAVVTMKGLATPTLIYIITGLTFVVFAFDAPARQSLVPNLVEKKDLRNALSLTILMFDVAVICGPAIAGFLIGGVGLASVYIINTVSFIALLIALACVHLRGQEKVVRPEISFHAILDGFRFVRTKPILWSTMILDCFSTFFSSATALLPIFAQDILRVGPQGLGILYAAPAAGSIVASLVFSHYHKLKQQGVLILSAITLYAVATIGFGLSRIFGLSLFFLSLVGAGDLVSTVLRHTIRQLETPDQLRGRMAAINMLFVMGGPQLGEFEGGLLAGLFGAPTAVVIGGVGTLIVVGLVATLLPVVRRYQGQSASI